MPFQFTLPTSGSGPQRTSKELLEEAVQAVIDQLEAYVGGVAAGISPVGTWDAASGSFPAGSVYRTYYVVNNDGIVAGVSFTAGDWLIPLKTDASTSDFSDWIHARYSQIFRALYGRAFASAVDVAGATGLIEGQVVSVDGRFYKMEPAGTYSENGSTVINSGALQAVLFHSEHLKDEAELRADTRNDLPLRSFVNVAQSQSVYEVANSGATDAHVENAGGGKLYEAGPNFTSRSRFVQSVSRNLSFVDGSRVVADGIAYVFDGDSTAISDLPGWRPIPPVDFKHFGAVADNSTNSQPAMQEAIDYVASLDGGGTVYGSEGKYAITSPLVWKPNVSFICSETFKVRATAAMSEMIGNPIGSASRVKRVFLRGGRWNANFLAERVVFLREFENVSVEGSWQFLNCNGNYIQLGTSGQSSGSYEAFISHGEILRETGNPMSSGTNSRGIYVDSAATVADGHINDVVISGAKFGVVGYFFNFQIARVHPWCFKATQGEMEQAFYIQGDNNCLMQCYADNAKTYFYHFSGKRNRLLASYALRGGSDYPDNTGTAVQVDTDATLIVGDNVFRSSSGAYRIAREFGGVTVGVIARANLTENVAITGV